MSLKLLIVRALYWHKGRSENPVELFTELGVRPDDVILEIGCAIGYHTLALAQSAASGQVYALDVWQEGLEFLKQRPHPGQNIETLCRSADAVDLPASSLDKVICFDTLHDVPNPAQAVKGWTRFLKSGGSLLFQDPEVSPATVEAFAEGNLRLEKTIRGISVFIRQ